MKNRLKTLDLNPHRMIHLAISAEDLEKMQMACEYLEQTIAGDPNRWKKGHALEKYAGEAGYTPGDLYRFGDKWSFNIRRILERAAAEEAALEGGD